MSKTREVRPFGARDKFGYLFGDLANDLDNQSSLGFANLF